MNPYNGRVAPYPLRMPPEIRSWYKSEADRNDRSLNSEILKILKDRMNRVKGQRTNEE